MTFLSPERIISTILKHDRKQTTYKIALLRAINDVVLAFPDIDRLGKDIAIPLRLLAAQWIAYYWPFVDANAPILQGSRAVRGTGIRNDMAFRPQLTALRQAWEEVIGGAAQPADGFFLVQEMRITRRRQSYPTAFVALYDEVLRAIQKTLEMPIRYAGPAGQEWSVFSRPHRAHLLGDSVTPIPGTQPTEICLRLALPLWRAFREVSLWVEALCIHEWSLFTESVAQPGGASLSRGTVFSLLTNRPGNRVPLTWERNSVDLLLSEGATFHCPWTDKPIRQGTAYDLDHVLPVAVYPINELWNLVPCDPHFNQHTKRDRLPSPERLLSAQPRLAETYQQYDQSALLTRPFQEDVRSRFVDLDGTNERFPTAVTTAVIGFVTSVAEFRNLARFN